MKKKYLFGLIICILLLALICGAILVVTDKKPSKQTEEQQQNLQDFVEEPYLDSYESPIDFEKLKKENSDIYAWLDIPGTDISYPVLQSQTDDSFYLDHDDAKNKDLGGALFSEHVYNKNDFSDRVVAIYGHHLKNGEMFGNLQQLYSDDFDKYSELVIYTPSEEIRYKVFAAAAFSNRHILYYYDCFKSELMMQEFIDDLKNVRAIGSYVDKDIEITENDQLLVLSTCLKGDRTCRFLVVGKRIERQAQ